MEKNKRKYRFVKMRTGDIHDPKFHPCCKYSYKNIVIVNLYSYSAVQDTKDYSMDNEVDIYTFYFACAFVIGAISLSLQIKNLCT